VSRESPPPYPSLRIRFSRNGSSAEPAEVWALLDTGFDGYFAVPAASIEGWPRPVRVQRVETATGEVVWVPVYLGRLGFVGTSLEREVLIIALVRDHYRTTG